MAIVHLLQLAEGTTAPLIDPLLDTIDLAHPLLLAVGLTMRQGRLAQTVILHTIVLLVAVLPKFQVASVVPQGVTIEAVA